MGRTARTAAIGVAGAVLGAGVAGGIAIAVTPSSGTLYGCVSGGASSDDVNPAGTLSVIDAGKSCPKGDQPITFNQPPRVPVTATAQGHHKVRLHKGHPVTLLSTKLLIGKGARMWTQPNLDIKSGGHRTTITVRLLINGKPDEAAVTTTVPPHTSQDVMPLFLCNEMPPGSTAIAIRVTSSQSGAVVGTRTLLAQADAG